MGDVKRLFFFHLKRKINKLYKYEFKIKKKKKKTQKRTYIVEHFEFSERLPVCAKETDARNANEMQNKIDWIMMQWMVSVWINSLMPCTRIPTEILTVCFSLGLELIFF